MVVFGNLMGSQVMGSLVVSTGDGQEGSLQKEGGVGGGSDLQLRGETCRRQPTGEGGFAALREGFLLLEQIFLFLLLKSYLFGLSKLKSHMALSHLLILAKSSHVRFTHYIFFAD